MILPEETYESLLANWPVARLASSSAAAQPHCVPIVFCQHHGAIYSPIDGKRKKHTRLQRLANLAANSRASLLLDDYTADWRNLWWLRIDGNADLHTPEAADAAAIAARLLDKYPQYQDPALMFDASAYLRLRPVQVTAWAQSNSPATIEAAIARVCVTLSDAPRAGS